MKKLLTTTATGTITNEPHVTQKGTIMKKLLTLVLALVLLFSGVTMVAAPADSTLLAGRGSVGGVGRPLAPDTDDLFDLGTLLAGRSGTGGVGRPGA